MDTPSISEHLLLQNESQCSQGVSWWYLVWNCRCVWDVKLKSHSKHLMLWAWFRWSLNRCKAGNFPKSTKPSLQVGHRGVLFSMLLFHTKFQLSYHTFFDCFVGGCRAGWFSLPVRVYLCFYPYSLYLSCCYAVYPITDLLSVSYYSITNLNLVEGLSSC